MAIRNRVSQDLRANSRVFACIDSYFTYEKLDYPAVTLDLSQKGAQLSSKFLPPKGSTIELTIRTPETKEQIVLTCTVLRSSRVITDHGPKARIAVRFSQTPLPLIGLLSRLLAK
jgi:hypothetical protein